MTSPFKLVGKIRPPFQAFSAYSDSANWPGDEAGFTLEEGDFSGVVTSPKSFDTGFVLRFTRTCVNRAI